MKTHTHDDLVTFEKDSIINGFYWSEIEKLINEISNYPCDIIVNRTTAIELKILLREYEQDSDNNIIYNKIVNLKISLVEKKQTYDIDKLDYLLLKIRHSFLSVKYSMIHLTIESHTAPSLLYLINDLKKKLDTYKIKYKQD